MRHSNEAFWWSLFSAGGVMAALFVPAIIVVTGFVLPFAGEAEPPAYADVHGTLSMWIVRLALFGVVMLCFFHCAHRVRHILLDLGFRGSPRTLSACCYGGALLGSGLAAVVLATL